jgi:hypothetical protein
MDAARLRLEVADCKIYRNDRFVERLANPTLDSHRSAEPQEGKEFELRSDGATALFLWIPEIWTQVCGQSRRHGTNNSTTLD